MRQGAAAERTTGRCQPETDVAERISALLPLPLLISDSLMVVVALAAGAGHVDLRRGGRSREAVTG